MSTDTTIVARRRHKLEPPDDPNHYLPCPKCKGYYSARNWHKHARVCGYSPVKGKRLSNEARSLVTHIHSCANPKLIDIINSGMRRDRMFEILTNDRLIIELGNHLTTKYIGHQIYMIKNYKRTLARYLQTIQTLDNKITKLEFLFKPQNFDTAMEAVQKYAGFNRDTGQFKLAKGALEMTHWLKVLSSILQCRYIKEDKKEKQNAVKHFAKLLVTEGPEKINKLATRNLDMNARRRMADEALPLTQDIITLKEFLVQQSGVVYKELILNPFTVASYLHLSGLVLLYIAVFNLKRSGDAHLILLEDYLRIKLIKEASLPEDFEALTNIEKERANEMYKMVIRGKLNATLTIYIPSIFKLYLDYLFVHRNDAGIASDNPYLFATPGLCNVGKPRILQVCDLMRKYTQEANLEKPELVRTRFLRKHFATKMSAMQLDDSAQEAVQDFMGHQEKIHKEFYRKQVVKKDLMLSQLLLGASSTTTTGESKSQLETNDQCPQQDTYEQGEETTNTPNMKNVKRKLYFDSPNLETLDPINARRRLIWNTPERSVAKRLFADHIRRRTVPTIPECKQAKAKEPALQRRNPAHIRAWIKHHIKSATQDKLWTGFSLLGLISTVYVLGMKRTKTAIKPRAAGANRSGRNNAISGPQ